MDFQAVTVDSMSIDEYLTDRAGVGPETAFLAASYIATPRALMWHNPSTEWRLFVLLVPLASRLSLMRNPIFTQLVRDWGMGVRFIGIDSEQRVFDFRRLLIDKTLRKLIDTLAVWLAAPEPSANQALDVLFAALADSMLTILHERRPDWPRHLDREHRLEPEVPASLFDRASRFPDFMKSLQMALRDDTIDIDFYSRALRSIDLRERSAEQRIAGIIESTLEPRWLDELRRLRAGMHLGCYNWLIERPQHAGARLYALNRLPCFAQVFAESMVGDAQQRAPLLAHALDTGQDRRIIEELARRFQVNENTMRALWRHRPPLGTPPPWQLDQIMRRLDALPQRGWPQNPPQWRDFVSRALPPDNVAELEL